MNIETKYSIGNILYGICDEKLVKYKIQRIKVEVDKNCSLKIQYEAVHELSIERFYEGDSNVMLFEDPTDLFCKLLCNLEDEEKSSEKNNESYITHSIVSAHSGVGMQFIRIPKECIENLGDAEKKEETILNMKGQEWLLDYSPKTYEDYSNNDIIMFPLNT